MAFIFNYSPTRGSLTLISTHGESHMNTCQGCGNQLSLSHTIFGNVLKLYVLQTRKVSQYLLLTVVSCQGLVSILTSIVSLQDPLQCLKSVFRTHSGRYFSYSKKRKNSQNEHLLSLIVICCHSLSFEVIRCLSLYHSLSFVVPLAVSLVCLFINNLIFFKNCWLKMLISLISE